MIHIWLQGRKGGGSSSGSKESKFSFSGQKMRGLRKIRKINLLCYCKIFLIPNLAGRVIFRALHPRIKLPPTQRKIDNFISELPRNLRGVGGEVVWYQKSNLEIVTRVTPDL